jgi:hypothetical protein
LLAYSLMSVKELTEKTIVAAEIEEEGKNTC